MSELGLSFGRVAELYERVRPPYAKEAVDRAQHALELQPSARVLDLAAGTGLLTRELAGRFAHVVAVEPDPAMRRLIPAGEVLAGTAEAIPLPAASVDAVFVGEALHWFDPSRFLPELARVLRPGGGFAALWNEWFATQPPLPEQALDLLREPYVASGRSTAVDTWRDAFGASAFEPLHDESFPCELAVDAETLLALYQTTSSIAALEPERRAALVDGLRPLLAGPYVLPVRVELSWTRLRR